MGEAAFWGFVAGSSLLIGAFIAYTFDLPRPVIGAVMAFGAGAMISAVSYDLVLESLDAGESGSVAIGLVTGALAFFVGDLIIDRYGGEHRKRMSGEQSSGNGPAIFMGTLLDGIPETFVIGLTLVTGGSVSAAFVASVFMSNLPEAMAATNGLKLAGWPRSRIYGMWTATVVVSIGCAVGGFAYYSNHAGAAGGFVKAFAAGALLTMIADSMLPEAFEYRGRLSGLLTVLGFGVAVAISQLEG
jgi:zinc transporter, ZIP family